MGDAVELGADGGVDVGVAVAVDVAPERRDAVDVAVAVRVDQVGALRALDDRRVLDGPAELLRERVPDVLSIGISEGVRHGSTLAIVQVGMPPLPLLVFVVGTGSLGAEIAAVRLLAPYFGASTIVWANTIGVVLVALSVGYWLGGKWADRNPTMRGLCLVTLAAAALLALVPFAADPLLDLAVEALDEISAGAFFGSLVAVLVLVAIPVLLLGAVSPWALRLAVDASRTPARWRGACTRSRPPGACSGRSCRRCSSSRSWARGGRSCVFALAIALSRSGDCGRCAATRLAPVAICVLIALPVGHAQGERRRAR